MVRGMFDGSDHYVLLAKVQIRDRWEFGKKKCKSEGRQVIACERLERKKVREEYVKKVQSPLPERGYFVPGGQRVPQNSVRES